MDYQIAPFISDDPPGYSLISSLFKCHFLHSVQKLTLNVAHWDWDDHYADYHYKW